MAQNLKPPASFTRERGNSTHPFGVKKAIIPNGCVVPRRAHAKPIGLSGRRCAANATGEGTIP